MASYKTFDSTGRERFPRGQPLSEGCLPVCTVRRYSVVPSGVYMLVTSALIARDRLIDDCATVSTIVQDA